MRVLETKLPGVLLIEPRVFADARGKFFESFQQPRYAEAGIDCPFVQDNLSYSSRGVLRGLHLQHPQAQDKLVSVIHGEVFDVVVDVRVGSPTFGSWEGFRLGDDLPQQVFVPRGYAHGFCVLSPEAAFLYKCSALYDPAGELSVRWDDPDLAIAWPIRDPIVSLKDGEAQRLRDIPADRLPTYVAG